MNEIWKDIKGYEGLYQVSNMARVKRLTTEKSKGSGNQARKEHILSQFIGNDYSRVSLWKNGKPHMFLVHRLVAETFIENPNNYPRVNHKDEIKTNNNISNLEFCTDKYNSNYGTARQRATDAISKAVVQKTLDGEIIKIYKSRKEAAEDTGILCSGIGACANGKRRTAGGYLWEGI